MIVLAVCWVVVFVVAVVFVLVVCWAAMLVLVV